MSHKEEMNDLVRDEMQELIRHYTGRCEGSLELMAWDYFEPADSDFVHRACCFCCAAEFFVEILYRTEGEVPFAVHRLGVDNACGLGYSHDELKPGGHPHRSFREVIGTDPGNDYYLFLKQLLERDGAFRSRVAKLEARAGSEWSIFYMVLNELDYRLKEGARLVPGAG